MKTTHAVIHLGIESTDSRTLPVLVDIADPENPQISIHVARYIRYQQKEGQGSYSKLKKTVAVIGRFHDYYRLAYDGGLLGKGDVRELVEDFLFAYDNGHTDLGWRPASNQQYLFARKAIAEYLSWVADITKASGTTIWHESERELISKAQEAYWHSRHLATSLLMHTKKRDRKKSRGRKRIVVGLKHFKPFPPHLVTELINETKNIRDKIFFMLCAYGGRRLSEIIQTFSSDYRVAGGKLRVILAHPDTSVYRWKNVAGQWVTGTRGEYLRTMFNGLKPRPDMGGTPLFAGWKGIKFDDEDAQQSELYFIRDVEAYLAYLHARYLRELRGRTDLPANTTHPFYFVNEKGGPLTIKAIEKQFRLACRRLEKKYGISLRGYGLHSLRHYYGFYCSDVLQVNLMKIQKWMGHVQPTSTMIYTHISNATAHELLKKAEEKAKLEGRIQATVEERISILSTAAEI